MQNFPASNAAGIVFFYFPDRFTRKCCCPAGIFGQPVLHALADSLRLPGVILLFLYHNVITLLSVYIIGIKKFRHCVFSKAHPACTAGPEVTDPETPFIGIAFFTQVKNL
jgi:hypothetical protein